VTKVYFPRLILPIASTLVGVVDFVKRTDGIFAEFV
jgi:hypothetical protein